VARLHLDKIGVKLTMLYDRQSAHISVPEGPSRSDQG
jgi:S-adenosylhomocysteine hydrolase